MNEKLKDWIKKQIISIETYPFRTGELGSEKLGEGQLLAYKEMLSFLENEEPEDKEFEDALAEEWKGYNDRGARGVDALEDNPMELAFSKGFFRGTVWKEKQLLSKNSVDGEISGEWRNQESEPYELYAVSDELDSKENTNS